MKPLECDWPSRHDCGCDHPQPELRAIPPTHLPDALYPWTMEQLGLVPVCSQCGGLIGPTGRQMGGGKGKDGN